MAKRDEDVDFDFFDSPRTTDKNERKENASKPRTNDTSSRDDVSESTVTSSKPPTHPNSAAAKRGKNRDDSSDSDGGRDSSPRSNASVSTTQSKRTIEAKIPSAGVQHDSDDDSDDKDNDKSDDDRSGSRSTNDRRSHSSSNDERSSVRSATPNGNARNVKDVKYSRKKSNSVSSRGSISSKEEPKPKKKSSEREKAKKKSAYLSDDDSDGSDVDITDTDSDVTEVSPLNSPHKPPDFPRQKSAKPRPVRNVSATNDRNGSMNRILSAHKDTMDLKVLLQTVLDMENEGSVARSRRIASGTGASSGDFCRQRKNFSFTNDQVMKIDRENQRLMENIMRKAREAKKVKQELKMAAKKQTCATPQRPASSAINRIRQQQRIEVENLGILRRLQQTRPTKELQRNVQIGEYKKQLVFAGCAPLSSIQPRSKSSFARYADSSMTKPPSTFDGSTDGDTIRRPRCQSAFVTRPKSGKRVSSAAKGSRPRSASLKKESTKDVQNYDDEYGYDFEVDELP